MVITRLYAHVSRNPLKNLPEQKMGQVMHKVPAIQRFIVISVMMAAVAVGGCSTARDRYEPTGPLSLLRFRDAETASHLAGSYRTGSLYLDFRPVLIVDALLEDALFYEHYLRSLTTHYFLTPEEAQRKKSEFEQSFETEVVFLVFLYEGTNDRSRLTPQENALWRLMLKDDDGALRTPLEIGRIKPESIEYAYLTKNFDGMDRWSQVYRVSFSKLSKGRMKLALGTHPFELIITGIKGTVLLRWSDSSIFYLQTASP